MNAGASLSVFGEEYHLSFYHAITFHVGLYSYDSTFQKKSQKYTAFRLVL